MPYRLLVVDDESALASAIAEYLTNRGFEVDQALDFERAAALLASVKYDLLLTDLRLTSKIGVEGFLLVLETRTLHPELPIIMLTGYETEEIREWTLSYPHSAFIRKPAPLSTIEAQIRALLEPSISESAS